MFRQFLRDLEHVLVTPVHLFILFAGTVVLTMSGPFGTFENMPYAPRAIFWLAVIFVSISVSNIIRLLARKILARQGPLVGHYLVAAMISVAISPMVFGVLIAFKSIGSQIDPDFLRILLYVSIVSFSIGTARFLFDLQQQEVPRLLARLPESQWGNLIRMTSNDHYVEVVTDKGSEQIRMRFSDALVELNGIDGVRVHRSHWVANNAVETSERENGRIYLRLVDGSRVPVSRGYMDDVRAAGLVDHQAA